MTTAASLIVPEVKEQAQALAVMRRAMRDPLFFASLTRTPFGPMPSFKFFNHMVLDFASGDDCAVAKSRQMMATWAACVTLLWKVMFTRGYSAGVTSRKERLVDDGGMRSTTNSLLGRIRHLYRSLPEFMRLAAQLEFTHLRILCEKNDSFIVGEGATTEIFRGSTLDNFLGDEWAYVPQSRKAYASARQACRTGAWLLSTPFGSDGSFADVVIGRAPTYRHTRLHWTEHPLRYAGELDAATGRPTSAWYRGECSKLILPDAIARELDISFSASATGLIFPEFSIERHVRADVKYDSNLPLCIGLDFGIGAATAGIIFQVHGPECWVLDDYEVENAPAEVNARNLWSIIQGLGYEGRMQDVRCFGDPAGNAREIATGSTVVREYRNAGFQNFHTPRYMVRDGIRLIRRMLFRGLLYFSAECDVIPRRIADYRYHTDDSGAVKGDEPMKNRSSHVCDGMRYGITGTFPIDDNTVVLTIDNPFHPPVDVVGHETGLGSLITDRPLTSDVPGMAW